ncbi:MAG: acetyl-CoA carboxylase biotin carboxyl carrier protein [Chloroflexota bacterium]
MSEQVLEPPASLIAAVEEVLAQLEGTPVMECELRTGAYRILVRRSPTWTPPQFEPVAEAQDSIPESWQALVAPLTGIFYLTETPQSPPFATVGAMVSERQVVGLIESMKMFNPVESDLTGMVRAIVMTGQQMVERGQVLMYVEPLGDAS